MPEGVIAADFYHSNELMALSDEAIIQKVHDTLKVCEPGFREAKVSAQFLCSSGPFMCPLQHQGSRRFDFKNCLFVCIKLCPDMFRMEMVHSVRMDTECRALMIT